MTKIERVLADLEDELSQAESEAEQAAVIAKVKADRVKALRDAISSVSRATSPPPKPAARPSAKRSNEPPISGMSNVDAVKAVTAIASPDGGLFVTEMVNELERQGHSLARRSSPVAAVSDVIYRANKRWPDMFRKQPDGRYKATA